MSWSDIFAIVALLFSNSFPIGADASDNGVTVRRPKPVVIVPDGGTVIFGGLPPITCEPVR